MGTYISKKSKYSYVAQITSVSNEDSSLYEVLNLCRNDDKCKIFVFPKKENRCWVNKEDLVQLDQQPAIHAVGSRMFDNGVKTE